MNYKSVDFYKTIYPKMRDAVRQTLEALWIGIQNSKVIENVQTVDK